MSTSKASRLFAAIHAAETEARLALRSMELSNGGSGENADSRVRRVFRSLRAVSHDAIAKTPKRSRSHMRSGPRPFFRYSRNGGLRFVGIGPLTISFCISHR